MTDVSDAKAASVHMHYVHPTMHLTPCSCLCGRKDANKTTLPLALPTWRGHVVAAVVACCCSCARHAAQPRMLRAHHE